MCYILMGYIFICMCMCGEGAVGSVLQSLAMRYKVNIAFVALFLGKHSFIYLSVAIDLMCVSAA